MALPHDELLLWLHFYYTAQTLALDNVTSTKLQWTVWHFILPEALIQTESET